MIAKYLFLGFLVKTIAGFDDTLTHIPILAVLTKKHLGQVAFSIGRVAAVAVAIIIAIFFSELITNLPYNRIIFASLIFAVAAAIYFGVFVHKPAAKAKKRLKEKAVTAERFAQLFGIGFVASFACVLDDIVVFLPLFAAGNVQRILASAGILAAAALDVIVVIYFSNIISKLLYKREIASIALAILGVLILTGAI